MLLNFWQIKRALCLNLEKKLFSTVTKVPREKGFHKPTRHLPGLVGYFNMHMYDV